MNQVKKWGAEEFWGLGFEFDPQWLLTDEQKALQAKLIELASTTLRDNAVESDKKLLFRARIRGAGQARAARPAGPKELGGLGQNHVCAAMVVETIARYGCASTAMCYTMHIGAVAGGAVPLSQQQDHPGHPAAIDKDVLIGTLSYSDPRPARISGTRSRPAPRRSMAAGRCASALPGPPPAALPTGTSCRPPARISAATTPT